MNKQIKYTCPKCNSKSFSTGTIRTSGSIIGSLFNIQNKRFTTIVCSDCMYTELFKLPPGKIGDDIDLNLPKRNKSFH
jgi:predicted nucleic-acid-binding Zn-ribbon protein